MSAQPVQTPRQLLVLYVRTQKTNYLRYDAEAARQAFEARARRKAS